MKDVIKISSQGRVIAFIVKARFKAKGVHFFTPDDFSQQFAYISWPKGHVINSHIHPPAVRSIRNHQEVIFIKKGKIRVDFYDRGKRYIESRIVGKGDILFLASGGHGYQMMKDAEMVEVKQGPFLKTIQPLRFEPVRKNRVRLKS